MCEFLAMAEQLKSDFDVTLDNTMAKELNIMCNLSEGIAEEAREEGKIEMVLNYIRKKKISIDAALEDLDVPDAKRPQYTARLQQLMS